MALHCHGPKKFYDDILGRGDAPYVDVYTWSPPCQDFSSAGKRLGLKGNKKVGPLLRKGLHFIKTKRPRLTIFENTPGLKTNKKFKPVASGIVKSLEKLGYVVADKVLNSEEFGAPAVRNRWFVVAIRRDSLRRKFAFPEPVGKHQKQTASDILDKFTRGDKSGRLPKHRAASARCKAAYRKAHDEHDCNPLKTPVLVDIDCSPKFSTFGINIAKTLTRTRGIQGGPWVSTRGRRVTTNEMLRLQGFDPNAVDWKGARITKGQLGGMVGNAVTVQTVGHLLATAMYASGLTKKKLTFGKCNNTSSYYSSSLSSSSS